MPEPITVPADEPHAAALQAAIQAGEVDAVRDLVTAHPYLATARFVDGTAARSALHMATDWPGHFPNVARTISALIAAGAHPDARCRGPHEETPLHWAASSDDVEALDALLDAGADIEAPGAVLGGGPPLADARGFKQWHAAFRLVERGAATTLNDAATMGLLDRVEQAFDAEPPPPPDEVTVAFWGACHGGRLDAARVLYAHGAGIDWVPPWEPLTPLDAAARDGADALVAWLREHGAHAAADLA